MVICMTGAEAIAGRRAAWLNEGYENVRGDGRHREHSSLKAIYLPTNEGRCVPFATPER